MLHFGGKKEHLEALALIDETLDRPEGDWAVDAMEDVFPWDFLNGFCTSSLLRYWEMSLAMR